MDKEKRNKIVLCCAIFVFGLVLGWVLNNIYYNFLYVQLPIFELFERMFEVVLNGLNTV